MTDLTSSSKPRTKTEYKAEIDKLLLKMEEIQKESAEFHERFDKTHEEIRKNLAETSLILDRVEAGRLAAQD